MENIDYNRYKFLKSKLKFIYKGICIEQVTALPIWNWANSPKPDYWYIRDYFFKYVDFSFLNKIGSDYILYSSEKRKDHSKSFQSIAEKVDDVYAVVNQEGKLNYKTCISLSILFSSFKYVFIHARTLGLMKKICIVLYVYMVLCTIDHLYKDVKRVPKKIVFLSSVHEWQNLLAQFFRLRGSKVIGMSHGTQFLCEKNIPIDCINYENLSTECLVWGQMTKDAYVKYGINSSDIHVAGYPKKIKLKNVGNNGIIQNCLVLLCRSQFEQSNIRLFDLLKTYSKEYRFSIKLHPSCSYEKYAKLSEKYGFELIPKEVMLTDCMDNSKYDIAIAVNTTSYYEILIAGIPCLRYDDGNAYDLMVGDERDRVASNEDFDNAIKWVKSSVNDGSYNDIREELLTYCLGYGIDNYRQILIGG